MGLRGSESRGCPLGLGGGRICTSFAQSVGCIETLNKGNTMFTRQKVVLALLLEHGSIPTKTQLMKWLFLLREETELQRDPSFYDFVPYRYGPFSFQAYRDLADLTKSGLLESTEAPTISDEAEREASLHASSLAPETKDAIQSILGFYGGLSTSSLVRKVYSKYPWFRPRAPEKRGSADIAVYTAGYEGRSIDAFLRRLLEVGILRILDVRNKPFSRKYGFSGRAMARVGSQLGLEYFHFPELGIGSERRKRLTTHRDYETLLNAYQRDLASMYLIEQERVSRLLQEVPSVLVCFEADVRYCHRSRLAEALAPHVGAEIVHL